MKNYKICFIIVFGLFHLISRSYSDQYRKKSTQSLKNIKAHLLQKSTDSTISSKERKKAEHEVQQINWILRDRN